MSTPLATVQSLYAAFGGGDVPAFLALLADDIEWSFHGAPGVPYSGTVRGHEAVAGWLGKVVQAEDIQAFEPREFFAGPDHVTVLGWERTVSRASGRTFETEWVHVFSVRDGRVSRFWGMYDTAEAGAAHGG